MEYTYESVITTGGLAVIFVLGFGSVELSRNAIGNQPRINDYYIIVNHVADPISESGMDKMALH